MDIFDDVRTIFKDSDLDIVEGDIDDELYNRKKEILNLFRQMKINLCSY